MDAEPDYVADARWVAATTCPIDRLREDAIGAALLGMVEAEKSYQPTRGASRRTWRIKNARWAVQEMMGREVRHSGQATLDPDADAAAAQVASDTWLDLCAALRVLGTAEATILTAIAHGYNPRDIARALRITIHTITERRDAGRSRLRDLLREE